MNGELCSTPWRAEYLHKLLEFFYKEELVLISCLLFNHLVMDSLILILYFGYNPEQLYFLAQIVLALVIGSFFCSPLTPSCCCVYLKTFFVEHLLTFYHYKMLQAHLIYSILVLRSAISPRSPSSFYWRMVLETNVWVLGVLFATGVSFILYTISRQSRDLCVCIYTWVYINICNYFYV